jgi:phosphosulfolactate phosphohydrolase-like enzyme
MHPLLLDPFVAGEIDAVLEKHRHALTPEQIEAFREKMAWTFSNHPTAQRILARGRSKDGDISGERLVDGAVPAASPGKQGGGEGR